MTSAHKVLHSQLLQMVLRHAVCLLVTTQVMVILNNAHTASIPTEDGLRHVTSIMLEMDAVCVLQSVLMACRWQCGHIKS